jgi:hypothetical protein
MLPVARNLGARDGAYFLAKAAGRWIAGPHRDTPGEPFATIEQDVRVSDDGVHWSIVDAPRGGVMTYYSEAEVFRDSVVIAGTRFEDDGHDVTQQQFFITSRDGSSWQAMDFRPSRNTGGRSYLCGPARCALVGNVTDDDGNFEHPFAWTSTDGLRWAPVQAPIEYPAGRASIGMDDVTWTGSEFLALGGGPDGGAWLSADGMAWRFVEIKDPELDLVTGRFAVLGDRVVSVSDPGDGSGRVTIWIGSLAAMRR